MPREYQVIFIAGLFLLAYLLDAVVDPLQIDLITPYHFLQPAYMATYPFTAASIIIKSLALFLTPLWLASFVNKQYFGKAGAFLILGSLMQLYALQEVATNSRVIPLEWSLALSLGGVGLLLPVCVYLIRGLFFSFTQNLTNARLEMAIRDAQKDHQQEV